MRRIGNFLGSELGNFLGSEPGNFFGSELGNFPIRLLDLARDLETF